MVDPLWDNWCLPVATSLRALLPSTPPEYIKVIIKTIPDAITLLKGRSKDVLGMAEEVKSKRKSPQNLINNLAESLEVVRGLRPRWKASRGVSDDRDMKLAG